MKKVILLLMILAGLNLNYGQNQNVSPPDTTIQLMDWFKAPFNIVVFGNYYFRQQNTNNNGNGQGLYIDYLPLKSRGGFWTAGGYLIGDHSWFTDNLSKYTANVWEIAGGGVLGYYNENFSSLYSTYIGFTLGGKYAQDNGNASLHGVYAGKQEDWLLCFNVNFNLLKRGIGYFPRTQVQLTFQKPIFSSKKASWNGEKIVSDVWDKTYIEVLVKQSIRSWHLTGDLFYSPKILTLYSYSAGNQRDSYGLGAEISINRQYQDDLFSLSALYKCNGRFDDNLFIFAVNINLSSIFGKK